ncbi:hypothetical protein [Luteibacter sp.]|uniref:hypothetical protein n=1 Tax=Luteibacter sp. TaxID=1886636 RepID=UPI003F7D7706
MVVRTRFRRGLGDRPFGRHDFLRQIIDGRIFLLLGSEDGWRSGVKKSSSWMCFQKDLSVFFLQGMPDMGIKKGRRPAIGRPGSTTG